MNLQAPISSIMSDNLIVLDIDDPVSEAKKKFDEHKVHHLLIEHNRAFKGLLSLLDYNLFDRAVRFESDRLYENLRKEAFKVKEIMTPAENITTLGPNHTVEDALKIFNENRFHSIPIIDDGRLVGIVTTHDIISMILDK